LLAAGVKPGGDLLRRESISEKVAKRVCGLEVERCVNQLSDDLLTTKLGVRLAGEFDHGAHSYGLIVWEPQTLHAPE